MRPAHMPTGLDYDQLLSVLDSTRNDEGPMQPSDVKRLKALETENAKLKKLLAERDLEIDLMREVNRRKW